MQRSGTVLLEGVVGSVAYGLDHAGSDVDRLGAFAVNTEQLFTLEGIVERTVLTTSPDRVLHEAGKLIHLLLASNPTVTELLWLDDYEVTTPLGLDLIGLRDRLICTPLVRAAYFGYAHNQFRKMTVRSDSRGAAGQRAPKHARHMARLLYQGRRLLTTGQLPIRVEDPGWYHEFSAAGPEHWTTWFRKQASAFDRIESVLPDQPDRDAAQSWLGAVRRAHLSPAPL